MKKIKKNLSNRKDEENYGLLRRGWRGGGYVLQTRIGKGGIIFPS